jgi:hypothetical protein
MGAEQTKSLPVELQRVLEPLMGQVVSLTERIKEMDGKVEQILGHRGPDTDLKRWGLKLAGRGGKRAKKAAVIAVARKLGILLRRLWVTGEVYEPLRNANMHRSRKRLAA